MPRLYKRIKKVGLPPGTVFSTKGEQKTKIRLIDYNEKVFQENNNKLINVNHNIITVEK